MDIIDEECRDSKKQHQTGYFRDGQRRIDMVLVCKDIPVEAAEQIKMDYLINAMSAGLHLEIETGMKEQFRHLMFIKVHTPDYLIRHFGYYYNMRKYFKESHLHYAKSNVKDETYLVKVLRQSYPGPLNYSTMERSLITYKILQAVTFGEPGNYVGLQRLLDRNIIIDAFPLHEGPFFLSKHQKTSEAHGRQALFYHWVGYRNLFRWQPIHLIREYLGERIAFLFAFFEYCNIMLLIVGVFGLITYAVGFANIKFRTLVNKYGGFNEYDYGSNKYDDLRVCKKCRSAKTCPYRFMDDYEKEVKFKVFIDNPYNLLASYVAIMGLLLLYALWRRRDYYLSWMWETNEKYDKKMPRPEFRPTERVPPYVTYSFKMNPKLLGSLRDINFTKILKKCVEFFVLLILLVVCVFVYISLMILFSNLVLTKFHKLEVTVKEKKLRVDQSKYNYYCMDILGTLNGIFVLFAETLWVSLAKALTDLLNTRTQLDYERSHVFKLFGMSLIINFNLIFFYAFLKGAFYTFPHDRDRKNMYLGISDMNCGMGTCIDELYLIFLSTFKVKKIYQEVISLLKRRKLKTDVFPLDDGYVDVPCWEREYQLLPVTQHYIMDRLNKIFILLCQGTFFVCIFPLAPIIIFMFCVWEIRYWAKELIVHSRRPLIPQNWGLSMWKYVLLFMPFCAAFVNSLTWARHTHYLDRQMNDRYFRWVVERRFFADHYMGFFEFSDTKLVDNELDIGPGPNDTVPDFCMFPGQYNRIISEGKPIPYTYQPQAGKWYINWHQALVVLIFLLMTVTAGLFVTHHIEKASEELEITKELEETLRQFHIGREPGEIEQYIQLKENKPKEEKTKPPEEASKPKDQ